MSCALGARVTGCLRMSMDPIPPYHPVLSIGLGLEMLTGHSHIVCMGPDAGCVTERDHIAARDARLASRGEEQPHICDFGL
jgi:hypothetical protein